MEGAVAAVTPRLIATWRPSSQSVIHTDGERDRTGPTTLLYVTAVVLVLVIQSG